MGEKKEALLWRFADAVQNILETPVIWFREKIVEPNRKVYPWYHQKFRRVPTIDECYTDDYVCIYEANVQYQKDRMVDSEIVAILRNRYEDCVLYNQEIKACDNLYEILEEASADWCAKHADLGPQPDAREAFMKQKHRMVWERRHGPVGSGMKEVPEI
ncbi:NADH dehydrogenase [ubiquinone] 1 beta subcomplex subunit 10 [Microplitis demolitor]|uniref:NADH dehydrogenase [ubiquinone] 1 beta subcomplex subunit 10 n=1 Tax=Microplitis demolitor TaxID=69319 RepID=UPI0004CD10F1|nr:NADH dehydrogenase [ubiquinone] 1 beta subcomplex subunit 10 [Microplitis demolitor]